MKFGEKEVLLRIEKYSYEEPGKQVSIELAEVVGGNAPGKWLARPIVPFHFKLAKPEYFVWGQNSTEALNKLLLLIRETDEDDLFVEDK